jgi:hypothetical protein
VKIALLVIFILFALMIISMMSGGHH